MRTILLTVLIAIAAPLVAQTPVSNAQQGYVLGPNDEIEVSVFGAHPLDVKTRIKADGSIVLPELGAITAAEHTPSELAELVAAKLRSGGYYVDPKVSVDVTSYVSRSVTLAGNLGNPGIYPLDRPQTVTMMIARAGGVRSDGADYVVLQRVGQPDRRISLTTVDDTTSDQLRPGDTLFVPKAEDIYVYGQVNKPGKFPIETGMTLRQAIAQAGGPTLAGSEKKVTLHRGGQKIKHASLDIQVKPGDVLYVNERIF